MFASAPCFPGPPTGCAPRGRPWRCGRRPRSRDRGPSRFSSPRPGTRPVMHGSRIGRSRAKAGNSAGPSGKVGRRDHARPATPRVWFSRAEPVAVPNPTLGGIRRVPGWGGGRHGHSAQPTPIPDGQARMPREIMKSCPPPWRDGIAGAARRGEAAGDPRGWAQPRFGPRPPPTWTRFAVSKNIAFCCACGRLFALCSAVLTRSTIWPGVLP